MLLPRKYAPVLFGAFLSGIMVSIVCACVLLLNEGLSAAFPAQWLRAFLSTWPIAFPTVLVIAPLVRRLVERLTCAPSE